MKAEDYIKIVDTIITGAGSLAVFTARWTAAKTKLEMIQAEGREPTDAEFDALMAEIQAKSDRIQDA